MGYNPFLLFSFLAVISHINFTKATLSVQTVSEVHKISVPAPRNLPSDAWRPTILTSCPALFYNESAPCRINTNIVYAEELIYPDFRIRLPGVVSEEQRQMYLLFLHEYRNDWKRGRAIDGYGYFLNQRGQNLVYANVSYAGRPYPGRWAEDACMSGRAGSHANSFPPWDGNAEAPAAVFIASPDHTYFQHFLDRVAMMLAQTRHLGRPEDFKYISLPIPLRSPVQELWTMMVPGWTPETLLRANTPNLRTRLLVYPCQSPLIHPYTQQLATEILLMSAGVDPNSIPPARDRPVVLFMTRQGSRRWHNEDECRQAVEGLLQTRGRGEQLMAFRATDYPSLRAVANASTRVKLVMGAHGGALNNIALMSPGTGVLEICPVSGDYRKSRCGAMFWETASVRNMPYWVVLANNTNAQWEILSLDCRMVVAAVRDALEGIDAGMPSPLERFYQGNAFRRTS
ncbi:hypothetical protein Agub_g3002 [Astrephomene gubernaculifera]|uniref:Glycosyltransferase 61 catalytic domain-containing protein n=1 Tax=Astrephomene gubernaculifera TaxID=47775 RepID=A0AAD3DHX8_9CHLO|nr:hypothetical protein Agub_g3002 [Astrephomene gubernaculifera]